MLDHRQGRLLAAFSFKEAHGNELDGQPDEDEPGYVEFNGAFGNSGPAQDVRNC